MKNTAANVVLSDIHRNFFAYFFSQSAHFEVLKA